VVIIGLADAEGQLQREAMLTCPVRVGPTGPCCRDAGRGGRL